MLKLFSLELELFVLFILFYSDVAPRFARAAGEEWNGRSGTPKRSAPSSFSRQHNVTTTTVRQPITTSSVIEPPKWNAPAPAVEHHISHPVEQIPPQSKH